MRIPNETLAYHSVIWFARDLDGHILLCDSCEGAVPAFVSENAEKAEQLAQAFCGINAVDRNRKPPVQFDNLAAKGFFCYLNSDPYEDVYQRQAVPETPLLYRDLPENLQQLLENQVLSIQATQAQRFAL